MLDKIPHEIFHAIVSSLAFDDDLCCDVRLLRRWESLGALAGTSRKLNNAMKNILTPTFYTTFLLKSSHECFTFALMLAEHERHEVPIVRDTPRSIPFLQQAIRNHQLITLWVYNYYGDSYAGRDVVTPEQYTKALYMYAIHGNLGLDEIEVGNEWRTGGDAVRHVMILWNVIRDIRKVLNEDLDFFKFYLNMLGPSESEAAEIEDISNRLVGSVSRGNWKLAGRMLRVWEKDAARRVTVDFKISGAYDFWFKWFSGVRLKVIKDWARKMEGRDDTAMDKYLGILIEKTDAKNRAKEAEKAAAVDNEGNTLMGRPSMPSDSGSASV